MVAPKPYRIPLLVGTLLQIAVLVLIVGMNLRQPLPVLDLARGLVVTCVAVAVLVSGRFFLPLIVVAGAAVAWGLFSTFSAGYFGFNSFLQIAWAVLRTIGPAVLLLVAGLLGAGFVGADGGRGELPAAGNGAMAPALEPDEPVGFCGQCGAPLRGGKTFCTRCGESIE